MTALRNLLAMVCACCPFCIVRRRFPESGYARVMRGVEKCCPFCRAYDRREGEAGRKYE
jgi:hypothetical protein